MATPLNTRAIINVQLINVWAECIMGSIMNDKIINLTPHNIKLVEGIRIPLRRGGPRGHRAHHARGTQWGYSPDVHRAVDIEDLPAPRYGIKLVVRAMVMDSALALHHDQDHPRAREMPRVDLRTPPSRGPLRFFLAIRSLS